MTSASDIIATIVGHLKDPFEVPADESVAGELVAITAEANARLERCEQAIAGDQLTKALAETEREPLLIPLCRQLAVEEMPAWKEACIAQGWPVPTDIAGTRVDQLAAALADFDTPPNLLKAYRRAARQRDLDDCILLLRRLASQCPGNPEYANDLKEFERRRLEELKKKFPKAATAKNEVDIRCIHAELQQSWGIPLPADFVRQVGSEMERLERSDRLAEARRMLGQLNSAYASFDLKGATYWLGKLSGSLQHAGLELEGDDAVQYAEAKAWCSEQQAAIAAREDFERNIEALGQAVARSDGSACEQILNALGRHSDPIPENLEERALDIVELWRETLERRRRRQQMVIGVVILILALVLAGVVRHQQIRAQVEAVAAELDRLEEALDVAAYRAALVRVEAENPRIFQQPELIQRKGRIAELEGRRDRRSAEFDTLAKQLEERLSGSDLDMDLDADLESLKELALSSGELERVSKVAAAWGLRKGDIARARRAAWEEWAKEIEGAFTQHEHGWRNPSQVDAQASLEQVKKLLDSHPVPPDAGAEDRLETYRQRGQRAMQRANDLAAQTRAIQTADSLSAFLEAVGVFREAFPEDPRSATMARTLDLADHYRSAIEPVLSAPPGHPFWGPLLGREASATISSDGWPALNKLVADWVRDPQMVDVYVYRAPEPQGSNENVFRIGPSEPMPNRDAFRRALLLDLRTSTEEQPQFKVVNEISEWRTDRHFVLMDHVPVVRTLLNDLSFLRQDAGIPFLLARADHWFAESKVPSLLRIQIGAAMLQCLAEGMAQSPLKNDVSALAQRMEQLSGSVHWLARSSHVYVGAERRAQEECRRAISLIHQIQQLRAWMPVDQAARQRNLGWLGFADWETGRLVNAAGVRQLEEMWLVRRTGGIPRYIVSARRTPSGTQMIIAPEPGEPVFYVGPRHGSASALGALRRAGVTIPLAQLASDPSWPTNLVEP